MAKQKAQQETTQQAPAVQSAEKPNPVPQRRPRPVPVMQRLTASASSGEGGGNGQFASSRARSSQMLQRQAGNTRLNSSVSESPAAAAGQLTLSTPRMNVGGAGLVMHPLGPPETLVVGTIAAPVETEGELESTETAAEQMAGGPEGMPMEADRGLGAPPTDSSPEAMGEQAPGEGETGRGEDRRSGRPEEAQTAEGEQAAGETAPEGEMPAALDPRAAIAPTADAVRQRAAGARRHPQAAAPVASAQAAAIDPATEQSRSAAAQTVENLSEAEAREVERQQFKEQLRRAVEAATPQPTNEDEAERVMETGAETASNALSGELAVQRDNAAGPMRSAAESEVPPSEQPSPAEVELQPEQIGPPPEPVSAASVVPDPLPAERLDYSADRAPADQLMAQNDVTTEQLADGNEPAFGPTLEARTVAEEHEATAEIRYRESEAQVQNQAQGQAQEALGQGLTGLYSERELRIGQVAAQQTTTRSQDAAERQRITETINNIKDTTRTDVNTILDSMEAEASEKFNEGLQRAEAAYDDAFEEAKGGIGTWLTTWGEDWEEHIEESLATARRRYLSEVDTAIDEVADLVATKLAEARQRVATGRKEVEDFVKGLDESVRQYGEQALEAVSSEFDALDSEINQRRDGLVNRLAQQYRESYDRMSAREQQLREENKSLWQRVYDATIGVIEKIIEFKNMLLGVLSRAADVVGDIIAHPIQFLGNLIDGVKLGLDNFISNIGTHLQQALMTWLFGTLSEAGIEMPESFDLQGILSLVLQVLGLTYANIRQRAVNILGEELVSRLEQVAEIFRILITEGPGGLWEYIKEKIGDLKTMVIDGIKDFVIERIIVAGINWVIGLLNPASAFIKACMAIYDIIKFFIERGSQIMALVNAVIDSLGAIVSGNISVAARMVEEALVRALPVVIGFLASLLGLGGISDKVREIIERIQEPINTAIDWVINQAVTLVRAAGNLLGFGREEPAAAEEVPETDDPEHDAQVQAGLAAIDTEQQRYLEDGKISYENAQLVAANVERDHPVFQSITVVDGGDSWNYNYAASPVNVYDTIISKLEGRTEPRDPEEMAIEREAGEDFNRSQASTYPINELYLTTGKKLDSYVPGRFIISRKRTQIVSIEQSTWERYLDEFDSKYARGQIIKDVPGARENYPHLIGQAITGQYVLEVAEQEVGIDDEEILNERVRLAERRGIIVRDHTGHVY